MGNKRVLCWLFILVSVVGCAQAELVTQEDVWRMRKEMQRQREELHDQQQRKLLKAREQARRQAKEHKEREQRERRCERVRERMAGIEQEFRSGYTAKRGEVLRRKLSAYKLEKRKYCKNE